MYKIKGRFMGNVVDLDTANNPLEADAKLTEAIAIYNGWNVWIEPANT